jgi:uncharacterized protein
VTPQTKTYEYWLPMVVFGAMTFGESYVPAAWFPMAYMAKAAVVTATLVVFRGPLADIRWNAAVVGPSILIGLAVVALWIGIDKTVPYPHFGNRTAFDPAQLHGSAWYAPFIATRLFGLVLMVPVMEEVFWRSFLLRYLTNPDFRPLAVGTFSASALWLMVAASALAHPEWLVAGVASLAYAWWLRRTGSLFGVIVAHAATNAALGGYVLASGDWRYW